MDSLYDLQRYLLNSLCNYLQAAETFSPIILHS